MGCAEDDTVLPFSVLLGHSFSRRGAIDLPLQSGIRKVELHRRVMWDKFLGIVLYKEVLVRKSTASEDRS